MTWRRNLHYSLNSESDQTYVNSLVKSPEGLQCFIVSNDFKRGVCSKIGLHEEFILIKNILYSLILRQFSAEIFNHEMS